MRIPPAYQLPGQAYQARNPVISMKFHNSRRGLRHIRYMPKGPAFAVGYGLASEQSKATTPFDFTQDHESSERARNPEPVEGPVEWQMLF